MSAAREDYLKVVYAANEPVTNGYLMRMLGVSAPSVSAMVKRLTSEGLLHRPATRRIALTGAGTRAALAVIRRHRLIETFLARALELPWDELHAEAEVLEHVMSPRLTERVDEVLGHPARDPHGDPIPSATGEHDERWGMALRVVPDHMPFRIDRVQDSDSAALRYLGEIGAYPGVVVEVLERLKFGNAMRVRIGVSEYVLADEVTSLVHGTVLGDQPALVGVSR